MSAVGAFSMFWLQGSEAFNWDEAALVLMITAMVIGGLLLVEWVRVSPRSQTERPARLTRYRDANVPFESVDWFWAIAAGAVGTALMTAIDYIVGLAGGPQLFTPARLAIALGADMEGYGWAAHLVIGLLLAFAYAMLFARALLQYSSPIARGAVFGLLPFLAAQLIVIPLMGGGVFNSAAGGAAPGLVISSLFQHLAYGATVGFVYAMSEREGGSDAESAA